MDADHFDDFTRKVARLASRRALLGQGIAAVTAMLGVSEATAKGKKNKGKKGKKRRKDDKDDILDTRPCGPDTWNGCCMGNERKEGHLSGQCGHGGEVCKDCTSDRMICVGNECCAIARGECSETKPCCPPLGCNPNGNRCCALSGQPCSEDEECCLTGSVCPKEGSSANKCCRLDGRNCQEHSDCCSQHCANNLCGPLVCELPFHLCPSGECCHVSNGCRPDGSCDTGG